MLIVYIKSINYGDIKMLISKRPSLSLIRILGVEVLQKCGNCIRYHIRYCIRCYIRYSIRYYEMVFRDLIQEVFQEATQNIGWLKKLLAKVVDLVSLGALSGPGAPDSDLGRFQIRV